MRWLAPAMAVVLAPSERSSTRSFRVPESPSMLFQGGRAGLRRDTAPSSASHGATAAPRTSAFDASYDDDESYEVKWRRRRIASLKEAPEILLDEVQDLFEPDYMQKKLWEQNPDAAFGCVFKLEGIIADFEVLPTFLSAWTAVAAEFDYAAPSERDVEYVVQRGVRNEVAIDDVFRWTRDWGEARQVSDRYTELVSERFDELEVNARDGVAAWLRDLHNENVPCAAVSKLPQRMLTTCLDSLNLTHYFGDRLVSAEDDRDRAQQAFLQAAVCLERQPSRVVVFSDSVDDIISAHEAEMRAVGIMGASPAYELRVADLVIRDMAEMRLANIRKIFSDVEFDPMPDLELLLETQQPSTTYDDYDDDYDDDESYY